MPTNFTDAELLAFLDEGLPVERMAAIETVLRQSAELRTRTAALRQQRDAAGHSVTVDLDPVSALPVKQGYQQSGHPVIETFSDWREVDGLQLPFKIVIEQAGQKVADVAVGSWKLNSGLKAEDLSKRP